MPLEVLREPKFSKSHETFVFPAPRQARAETRQSLTIPIPGDSSGKSKDRELVGSSLFGARLSSSRSSAKNDWAHVGDRLSVSHRVVFAERVGPTMAANRAVDQEIR